MSYDYKKANETPIVNLSAKMDDRSNNEILDGEDINQTGLIGTYIQNADLFNTKSVSSRKGTKDICGGIVDDVSTSSVVFDVSLSGNFNIGYNSIGESVDSRIWRPKTPNHLTDFDLTNIFIPNAFTNAYSGNVWIQEVETTSQYNALVSSGQIKQPIDIRITIDKLNQSSLPASGISFFSGNGTIHDIALSGNVNVPPYPHTVNTFNPSINYPMPEGIAVANILFDDFKLESGGHYASPPSIGSANTFRKIPFKFESPVNLFSGNVYSVSLQFNTIPQARNVIPLIRTFVVANTFDISTDLDPRVRLMTLSGISITDPFVVIGPIEKQYIAMDLWQYNSPNYAITDYFSSNQDFNSPLFSGNDVANHMISRGAGAAGTFFNGAITTPPISTKTVEFGQIIATGFSGTFTFFGGYFYATPDRPRAIGLPTQAPTTVYGPQGSFTRSKMPLNPDNYNLGYVINLSTVDVHTGSFSAGNYTVLDRTIIASYSGNHVFNKYDDLYNFNDFNTNYNLTQLNAVFSNAPTIDLTTPTDLMLSVKYYDYQTGGDYTDYSYANTFNTTPLGVNTVQFRSFMREGFRNPQDPLDSGYYGSYLINSNDDGETFISPSGIVISGTTYFDPKKNTLTCGLYVGTSGNAITGIYDYRITNSQSQAVIYEQADKINYFTLQNPEKANHINLFSGAAVDNDFKWTHNTLQNLMFASQYSQSTPQCWDQIFSNPSGNSTQVHGLRPVFDVTQISAIVPSGVGPSGTGLSGISFSLMMSTEMVSGGIRASEIVDVQMSGTNNAIQISGNDFFNNVSPFNTEQYYFDILDPSGQSTYVWATQNSGATFFLAGMVNDPTLDYNAGAGQILNPLFNTNSFNGPSGTFINDISSAVLTQEVPAVVNYDQRYLVDQVDVPRIKKWIVFQNTLIGAGDKDNPCRLWLSQQLAPQIFGTDGVECNFVDIDIDDGSPITGMEIFHDRILVFKYNSMYVLSPTGDTSNPFQIQKMSVNIGCLGFFTTVSTDMGVIGLSQFGPFIAGLQGSQTIGDEIIPFFSTLDHTDLTFSYAIHDKIRNQIYWSISNKVYSPDNNYGLIYNYKENAWAIRQGNIWNVAGIVGDEDNFSLLFTGDTLGQIQQLEVGDADTIFVTNTGIITTKNISLEIETPWLNFGNSEQLKQLKNLRINCDNSQQRLKIDVYFDQDETTPKYTRYLNLGVPVINRVISLAGVCRTVKFVITSAGLPDKIKLNSIQLAYTNLGNRINI